MKFLATMEVNYLHSDLRCPQIIDTDLSDGQVAPVTIKGMDLLRLHNLYKTYVRVMSVEAIQFRPFHSRPVCKRSN